MQLTKPWNNAMILLRVRNPWNMAAQGLPGIVVDMVTTAHVLQRKTSLSSGQTVASLVNRVTSLPSTTKASTYSHHLKKTAVSNFWLSLTMLHRSPPH